MLRIGLFLPAILVELPVFLVEMVGAIIALVRWNYHPRSSFLAVVGLLIMLTSRVGRVAASLALPVLLADQRRVPFLREGTLVNAVGLGLALVEALGLALLLAAAFQKRAEKPAV